MRERIYFISGLGADKRVFQNLNLPSRFELVYLDWIYVLQNESLENYAARLALKIDTSIPFYLIGVSFGGFLATEIAKKLNPRHTFIISSMATFKELPWYYKLAGSFNLQKLIPVSILKHANAISYRLFGVKTPEEKQLLKNILADTDPTFLKWALTSTLNWKNTERPMRLTSIHGTADKIIPIKYVQADHFIQGGEHLMVYSKATEIMKILRALVPF